MGQAHTGHTDSHDDHSDRQGHGNASSPIILKKQEEKRHLPTNY